MGGELPEEHQSDDPNAQEPPPPLNTSQTPLPPPPGHRQLQPQSQPQPQKVQQPAYQNQPQPTYGCTQAKGQAPIHPLDGLGLTGYIYGLQPNVVGMPETNNQHHHHHQQQQQQEPTYDHTQAKAWTMPMPSHQEYVVPPPVYTQTPFVGTEGWTTDLFDCLEDPNSAVVTFCFPCITAGQISEILDSGNTPCNSAGVMYGAISFLFGACFLYSFGYRTKLRMKYNLVESPASDLLTHFLCEWCALSQEYRELKKRGLDPSLGWNGNMARQKQRAAFVVTPPKPQMMLMI